LSLLVFLMTLFIIIEVARIMFAYVTLQNAARQGARFAVTGQWMREFAEDPMWAWDSASADPLQHIAPCWPRFYDDPAAPTLPSLQLYEPYRNARTCSVEYAVVRGMAGLALDPLATPGQPNYYELVVRGGGLPAEPAETFTRGYPAGHPYYNPLYPLQEKSYGDYGYTGAGGVTLVRGFAGLPQQKVVVQIAYRLPIITPILSSIAPSLEIRAQTIMTNESFGSTSLQREAILPPELPPVPTLGAPVPADLVPTLFQAVTPLSPAPFAGQDVVFEVSVTNIGELNAIPASPITIRLYASDTQLTPESPLSGGVEIGSATLASLDAGTTSAPVTVITQFPTTGTFWVYAWVDTEDLVDEDGLPDSPVYNPNRESNNVIEFAAPVVIGDSIDLSVVKSASSPTVPEGGSFLYTLDVANAGPAQATDVVLTDPLPAGLAFDPGASSPECSLDAGLITCTVATVDVGAPVQFTLGVVVDPGTAGQTIMNAASVTTTSALVDSNLANNTSNSVSVVVLGIDLEAALAVDNANPNETENITFTATVTNAGLIEATGVAAQLSLPPGLAYISHAGGVYNAGTGNWQIGSLAASGVATLQVTARVDAPGVLTTSMEVVAADQNDGDSTPGNGSGEDDYAAVLVTAVPNEADTRITSFTVSDSTPNVGDTITFSLTIRDDGPQDATDVSVADILPAGVTYVSHVAGDGAYDSGTDVWTLPLLTDGQTLTLTVTATVDSDRAGQTLGTTASVTQVDPPDPDAGNNSASVSLIVTANEADLRITVFTVSDTTPDISDVITYTITILNDGPQAATGVTVSDVIPAGVTYQSHVANSGSYTSGTDSWAVPSIASAQSYTLSVTVQVDSDQAGQTLSNTATAAQSGPPDPDMGNNTATAIVNVNTPASIYINIGPNSSPCNQVQVWGNPAAGLQYGHPLIGMDVSWVPFSWATQWTVPSVTMRSNNQNVYAPGGTTWPSGSGAPLSGDGDELFYCRTQASSSGFNFDVYDLAPGTWRVILLWHDYLDRASRRTWVEVDNGSSTQTLLSNMSIANQVGSGTLAYYITTHTITVTSSGTVNFRFWDTNGQTVLFQGLGLEFIGP
jgi:uncharacterized repeat protein (TIGR01451 family)